MVNVSSNLIHCPQIFHKIKKGNPGWTLRRDGDNWVMVTVISNEADKFFFSRVPWSITDWSVHSYNAFVFFPYFLYIFYFVSFVCLFFFCSSLFSSVYKRYFFFVIMYDLFFLILLIAMSWIKLMIIRCKCV